MRVWLGLAGLRYYFVLIWLKLGNPAVAIQHYIPSHVGATMAKGVHGEVRWYYDARTHSSMTRAWTDVSLIKDYTLQTRSSKEGNAVDFAANAPPSY